LTINVDPRVQFAGRDNVIQVLNSHRLQFGKLSLFDISWREEE